MLKLRLDLKFEIFQGLRIRTIFCKIILGRGGNYRGLLQAKTQLNIVEALVMVMGTNLNQGHFGPLGQLGAKRRWEVKTETVYSKKHALSSPHPSVEFHCSFPQQHSLSLQIFPFSSLLSPQTSLSSSSNAFYGFTCTLSEDVRRERARCCYSILSANVRSILIFAPIADARHLHFCEENEAG